MEHFVTLFDSHYLPMGLALHRSLQAHAGEYTLWVLCMDEAVEQSLRKLALPNVRLIALADVETVALRRVKSDRSIAEYCWTLTPFTQEFVWQRAPDAERVTYVDADVFFFDRPAALLDEFERSGKDVLITDHAFAPEYSDALRWGRYCVQFMSFRRTEAGLEVLRWWQERCLEWCYARDEDGKFGDQKYLDDWPQRFAAAVHVLEQTERTLAPWNIHHMSRVHGHARPVFYHFHSLRLYKHDRVRLFSTYRVGSRNMWIYDAYVAVLREALQVMRAMGIAPRTLPIAREPLFWLRRPKWWLQGRLRFARV